MQKPEIIIDSIEVNIKAPQELHVVRPHSGHKSSYGSQHQIPQTIEQQQNPIKQVEDLFSSTHKLRHIESIEDKGEFIDQNAHQRLSEKDQARETISRAIHPQAELPIQDPDLQRIAQQYVNEEENSKPLKHINVDHLIDRDEFNLGNSRQKRAETRKRRYSETGLKGYGQQRNILGNGSRFGEMQKTIPEKTIEEQSHSKTKKKSHSVHRRRKSYIQTAHECVSEEIRRMIVDELDKKKNVKFQNKNQEDNEEPVMEEIKQQKQQDDNINVSHLEHARQKIQGQLSGLSKVVGAQIGPQEKGQHLYMEKTQPIEQDGKEDKEN